MWPARSPRRTEAVSTFAMKAVETSSFVSNYRLCIMSIPISQPLISVLVVDDDPAFRKGLTASLKASGYAVDLSRNAEDALSYVRERPVDVVLLDMNMPEIGGVEACQRIRAMAPRSGIIMLTVRDAEDDKVQALEAGAD